MDLSRASSADLRQLRDRLQSERFRTPLTRARLRELAHLESLAPSLLRSPLDATALIALVDAVLAERARRRTEVEFVWTGPDTVGAETRDTAQVLRSLFAEATKDVLVAGYTFDHGAELFRPLRDAMLRNVSAALFLNVSHRAGDADEIATEAVAKFIATQWPEASAPLPRFYFDPRTVGSAPYLSLHAKCVVVDSRRALIGSANFTNRGTERNIECGVVVDDSVFAERVRKQWMDMVSRGHAREVPTRAS